MKYCKKCVYPDTKPGLIFDKEDVCNACRNHERKNEVNWEERREEFLKIVEKFKSKNGSLYDCVIPVSGGKDSHYQSYFINYLIEMRVIKIDTNTIQISRSARFSVIVICGQLIDNFFCIDLDNQ